MNEAGVVATVAVAIVLQGLVGLALGLYRRRYHYGSFDEVRVLGFCVAIVGVATFVLAVLFGGTLVPRSVPVLAAFLDARAGRGVPLRRPARRRSPPAPARRPVRADRRLRRRRRRQPDHAHAAAQPEQPVPAGRPGRRRSPAGPHAAQRAARARHRRRRPRRRHPLRRRLGAGRHPVDHRRAAPRVRRAAARGRSAACWCCRRSPSSSVTCGRRTSDRSRSPTSSAGTRPRSTRRPSPATSPAGGCSSRAPAARSAPSCAASCTRFHPSALVMLDRDESGLHGTQLELEGRALLDSPSLVLADIRDRERIFQVFQQHRPEVVFHAAALKHLPLLEFNPVRGVEDQRRRHPSRARGGGGVRRRPARQHQHRQGGRPGERARVRQAHLRAAHRRGRRPHRPAVRLGALRQRARLEGVDARRVRAADPRRRADHRHPSRRDPLLHDVGGGHRADHPGRGHRPTRRGARARHGRAGAHRRGRHPPGRAGPVDGRRSSTPGCVPARSCTRCCSAPARSTCGPPIR